jgi:hypothetical protein
LVRARASELTRSLAALTLERRHLFDLDLAFELQLAQFDEELALLGDQRFGLALQLLDPFGGAFRRRLRPPARRLAAQRHHGARHQTDQPHPQCRRRSVSLLRHL